MDLRGTLFNAFGADSCSEYKYYWCEDEWHKMRICNAILEHIDQTKLLATCVETTKPNPAEIAFDCESSPAFCPDLNSFGLTVGRVIDEEPCDSGVIATITQNLYNLLHSPELCLKSSSGSSINTQTLIVTIMVAVLVCCCCSMCSHIFDNAHFQDVYADVATNNGEAEDESTQLLPSDDQEESPGYGASTQSIPVKPGCYEVFRRDKWLFVKAIVLTGLVMVGLRKDPRPAAQSAGPRFNTDDGL